MIKDSYQNTKSQRKICIYIQKPWRYSELQREITLIALAPSSDVFITSIHLENKNVFARFDEIPLMTL